MVFIEKRNIVVVMGGFIMVIVVEMMIIDFVKGRELFFVFGCGGIGEDFDN